MSIEKEMIKIGLRPDLRGFKYLAEAMKIIYENEEFLYNTLPLYEEIALDLELDIDNVERCIRHCIKAAPYNVWLTIGYTDEMRKINSVFISLLYYHLMEKEEDER